MKANKPDQVVDVTRLFASDGLAPQGNPGLIEGPGHRSEDQRRILFPDPLGILDNLTHGVVHDPFKKVIAKVFPPFPAHEKK